MQNLFPGCRRAAAVPVRSFARVTASALGLVLAAASVGAIAGPIQQSVNDATVVIDAGDFDGRVERNGANWQSATVSGATGAGALQALPNRSVSVTGNIAGTSPRVDYQVNFAQAGRYYVWVRGYGASGQDDSVHVGLNGAAVASADNIRSGRNGFEWTQATLDGPVATIDVPSAGVHTVNVFMREDGFYVDKLVLTPDSAYAPSGEGPAPSERIKERPPIQQPGGSNGTVSIDATDFDDVVERNGAKWQPASAAGATGGGALQALPNRSVSVTSNIAATSPRVDYKINFTRTGLHYVWIRGYGASGQDDSVHVGLNGAAVASADNIRSGRNGFEWTQATLDGPVATINVPSIGVHTLNVFMREDGFLFDKLVLVPDVNFVPSGEGPTATARDSDSAARPPVNETPSAAPDTASTDEGTRVAIDVLANDRGLGNAPLTVRVTRQPGNGSARVESDNRISYTPNALFYGSDSFIYSVTDADGESAVANVAVNVACTTCADDVQVRLRWAPNTDQVNGYRIYFGATAATATERVAEVRLRDIDASAPAMTFNAASDLGMRLGNRACFKISAYNDHGESDKSGASCVDI